MTKEKEQPEQEPEEQLSELDQLKQEASEFRHKYLHLLADSENARKRLQKDRHEIVQYAVKNILVDILHPIDHLENALKFTEQASDEVKHWAAGFHMILTQFKDVLANQGVYPIDAVGKVFDPHFHEAIEMVETEEFPPGTVIEENIKGYKMGENTLRPARVKVSKAPGKGSEEPEEPGEEVKENKHEVNSHE